MISSYYIELGAREKDNIYKLFIFDDEGIPKYPYANNLEYNISFICHFALYQLSIYMRFGKQENLDYFLKIVLWILRTGREKDNTFDFPYLFVWQKMNPPWISAIGQGRILSVLSRAYEITGNQQYLLYANKTLRLFDLPIDKGGLQVKFPDGQIAFEEYPGKCSLPNIVLNGFITSIFGIYDLSKIQGNKDAERLWKVSIASLVSNLYRYDLGYWSAYSLEGLVRYVSEVSYHELHIKQLWSLYDATGLKEFKIYAERWSGYKKNIVFLFFYFFSRFYNRMVKLNHWVFTGRG